MRLADTNILLYAVSPLPEEADKIRRAREILEEPDLAVSVQILQEFYYQAMRPTGPARLTHEEALAFLEAILELPVQEVTVELFHTAVAISHRYRLSYWDGAILAAAQSLGCDAVYSEDLSPQQDYNGLRVINPFRESEAA